MSKRRDLRGATTAFEGKAASILARSASETVAALADASCQIKKMMTPATDGLLCIASGLPWSCRRENWCRDCRHHPDANPIRMAPACQQLWGFANLLWLCVGSMQPG